MRVMRAPNPSIFALPSATLLLLLLALAAAPLARAGELFADASAAPGGDGSPARPFQTITAAIKAAQGGDTITVRQGTYREAVTLATAGTPEQPTTLRAAPGERAILSGFAPVTGWQAAADGLYTATVDGPVNDLYVGLAAQPISRWPGSEQPMRYVKEPNKTNGTFRDADLKDAVLKEVAAAPKALLAFLYVARGNYFATIPLTAIDPAAGTLTAAKPGDLARLQGTADRYQLINHPRLIARPGEWAYEPLADGKTRITFRPRTPEDLKQTQVRRLGERGLLHLGGYGPRAKAANIRIEGLEVCGSAGKGIEAGSASGVTVARCLLHNNRSNGLGIRRSDHFQILDNLVLANGSGVGIASSHDVLVQENEIGLNNVDGLVVAGNISGRPGVEPETADVTARRNYIHHHLLLSHPDNMQTYRGVRRLTVEDSVYLWGGQGIMTEETDTATIRNCAIAGTAAVAVIFGHGNSNDWTVERSTIGLGGWGAFSFTGKDYRLRDSIVWNNTLPLAETLTSDYNLLFNADPAQPLYLVTKPKWKRLTSVAEAAALGKEQHSLAADPQFRNAPAFQAPARWDDANTPGFLKLRGADYGTFAVGDKIEINGDGVLRTVTAATADSVTFAPPLPARSFRDALIWNWKKADSTALDLRPRAGSPALKAGQDGKPVGAQLDIPAYVRGDFNGDGKREIPALPDDVKAALPDPNAIVLPVQGA